MSGFLELCQSLAAKNAPDQVKRNQETDFPDLEDKRKFFAYKYLAQFDHRQAAEDAGFSPDMGIKLIREPLLEAFIEKLKAEQRMRLEIDADQVRMEWLAALDVFSGKKPIPGTDVCSWDGSNVVATLKELSKIAKVYDREPVQETGPREIRITVVGQKNE